jgi:hypothetical protein
MHDALEDCRAAVERANQQADYYRSAIASCVLAERLAQTPEDRVIASQLIAAIRSRVDAAEQKRVLRYDNPMAIDPDTRRRVPWLHQTQKQDDAMVINPDEIGQLGASAP